MHASNLELAGGLKWWLDEVRDWLVDMYIYFHTDSSQEPISEMEEYGKPGETFTTTTATATALIWDWTNLIVPNENAGWDI